MHRFHRTHLLALSLVILALAGGATSTWAQTPGVPSLPLPSLSIGVQDATEPSKVAVTLQIVALLTVLSLAPAILILTTSFTRIAVVLSFLRTAIGTSQLPPNQIVIGLALFLTFFVMKPTWTSIHAGALEPYFDGEISGTVALERATAPMKDFMLQHTRTEEERQRELANEKGPGRVAEETDRRHDRERDRVERARTAQKPFEKQQLQRKPGGGVDVRDVNELVGHETAVRQHQRTQRGG